MKSVIDISNKILLLDNKIFPEGTNIFRVVFKSLSIAWYARRSSVKALRFWFQLTRGCPDDVLSLHDPSWSTRTNGQLTTNLMGNENRRSNEQKVKKEMKNTKLMNKNVENTHEKTNNNEKRDENVQTCATNRVGVVVWTSVFILPDFVCQTRLILSSSRRFSWTDVCHHIKRILLHINI